MLSQVQLSVTRWTAEDQASLSSIIFWSLLIFMSIELEMLSKHLLLSHPLFLLLSIFPNIRVSSYESSLCLRWPKYWSFSVSISPSNEYSGLISFRTDWYQVLKMRSRETAFLFLRNRENSSPGRVLLWYFSAGRLPQLFDNFISTLF